MARTLENFRKVMPNETIKANLEFVFRLSALARLDGFILRCNEPPAMKAALKVHPVCYTPIIDDPPTIYPGRIVLGNARTEGSDVDQRPIVSDNWPARKQHSL